MPSQQALIADDWTAPSPTPAIPPRRSGRVEELERQLDGLRAGMRIAVIYGGDKSSEGSVIHQTQNPRSWKSYKAVAKDIAAALENLGFHHVILVPDDMHLATTLASENIHLAWLNTGGVQGYNPMSHAPAMLEMLGIPYVGHDPLIAGTLDNKHIFKQELLYLDIPTAPFITWHPSRGPFRPKVNSRFIQTFKNHWGSYIVKPVSGRASLHVHYVERECDLPDAVAQVYEATGNHVLIEAYLPGREYCVGIGGFVVSKKRNLTRRRDPFVFAEIERAIDADEKIFTSMDVKPITSDRVRVLDEKNDEIVLEQLRDLARKVAVEMNFESLVRLDIRSDSDGRLFVLEANPKPDLKHPSKDSTSLICATLPKIGMDYEDLIFSVLANKIDLLFSQRRGTVSHLLALLN